MSAELLRETQPREDVMAIVAIFSALAFALSACAAVCMRQQLYSYACLSFQLSGIAWAAATGMSVEYAGWEPAVLCFVTLLGTVGMTFWSGHNAFFYGNRAPKGARLFFSMVVCGYSSVNSGVGTTVTVSASDDGTTPESALQRRV